MTAAHRGLNVKVIQQGHKSMQNYVCYTSVSCSVLEYWLMAVVAEYVISYKLTRRGVRRGAGQRRSPSRMGLLAQSV